MRTRRRALLAVVAVLLTLLSPTVTPHTGTGGARLLTAVPDAVPAARLSSRDHHEAAPVLDGSQVVADSVAPAVGARAEPAPAASRPYLLSSPRRSRGPPQV